MLLSSIQVMTFENYQQTMYSVVRASSYGAVAWFIVWIVLGEALGPGIRRGSRGRCRGPGVRALEWW